MQTETQQVPQEKELYLFDSNKCGKKMKISAEKLDCTNTGGKSTAQTETGFGNKGTRFVHFKVLDTDKDGDVTDYIGIGQQI